MESIAKPAEALWRRSAGFLSCSLARKGTVFMGMGIFTWIVMGLVASWLASQFMRSGYGRIGEAVLDFVGAIVDGSCVVRCWGAIWR